MWWTELLSQSYPIFPYTKHINKIYEICFEDDVIFIEFCNKYSL